MKEQVIKLNDDDYIAKLARKEYFLSESDEIIFTLPSSRDPEKGRPDELKVLLHSFILFCIIYSKYDFVYF